MLLFIEAFVSLYSHETHIDTFKRELLIEVSKQAQILNIQPLTRELVAALSAQDDILELLKKAKSRLAAIGGNPAARIADERVSKSKLCESYNCFDFCLNKSKFHECTQLHRCFCCQQKHALLHCPLACADTKWRLKVMNNRWRSAGRARGRGGRYRNNYPRYNNVNNQNPPQSNYWGRPLYYRPSYPAVGRGRGNK